MSRSGFFPYFLSFLPSSSLSLLLLHPWPVPLLGMWAALLFMQFYSTLHSVLCPPCCPGVHQLPLQQRVRQAERFTAKFSAEQSSRVENHANPFSKGWHCAPPVKELNLHHKVAVSQVRFPHGPFCMANWYQWPSFYSISMPYFCL